MRALRGSLVASVALLPTQGFAQGSVTLDEISVVATTPVPSRRAARPVPIAPDQSRLDASPVPQIATQGRVLDIDGVDRNKLSQNTYVLNTNDVSRVGTPSVLRSLDERVGSIGINNAQGNPFQPAITFRGFEASPLGGSPQGVAVYVNGSRFNTSFGDTVQWDLIPDIAVDRIELEGSNPAFGLNALGGSLSVSLKNGFTYQGNEVSVWGGSFGRGAVSFQHGSRSDNVGLYVAGTKLAEDGWRKHSPSRLNQIYADLGVQADRGEFHFNFLGASNNLTGNGTAPVELLALNRTDVFTYPDKTINDYGRFQVSGTYDITSNWTVQGNAYYGIYRQKTFNGDAAEVETCEDAAQFVCSEGANEQQFLLRDLSGNPVLASRLNTFNFGAVNPAFAERFDEGGPYAFLNRTNTRTDNYGTTVQTTWREEFWGMKNRFVLGGSYDGGFTRFTADNQIGGLTFNRGFAGPGITVRSDDNSITPVGVNTTNDYGGVYFSNITDVTDQLTVTLQGRYNIAKVRLRDQIGTDLNGNHSFERFNPGAGAAYKLFGDYLSVYGGYVEANRAPTPAELSCADDTRPCSLTNFFVGDPPLKQVVARTIEGGVRGRVADFYDGALNWRAGYFRTRSDDDILFIPSSTTIGRAFFKNVGSTKREGVEAGIAYTTPTWNAFVDYAYVKATFETALTLNSGGNPFAVPNPAEPDNDEARQIFVKPGDRLPGVAPHQIKLGFNWFVTPQWKVGALMRYATGKFLVGDESNLNPKTGSYAVFGFNTSYQVTENIQLFGFVENALDKRYATFGTFSPVSEVPIIGLPNASNNRSLAPGAPIAGFGGLRITW